MASVTRRTGNAPPTSRPNARKVSALQPVAWLQLRIALRWVEPEVWRVVLVPETITLKKLHHVIQTAMGWYDCHLHEFVIGDRHYGVPDLDGSDWGAFPLESENRVPLQKALGRTRHLRYIYDYGDGWEHAVTIERRLLPPPTQTRIAALCVAGENACPPDDVGGPPGYEAFRIAIADPNNEDHERMFEWYGGEFDPGHCDIALINRQFSKL